MGSGGGGVSRSLSCSVRTCRRSASHTCLLLVPAGAVGGYIYTQVTSPWCRRWLSVVGEVSEDAVGRLLTAPSVDLLRTYLQTPPPPPPDSRRGEQSPHRGCMYTVSSQLSASGPEPNARSTTCTQLRDKHLP